MLSITTLPTITPPSGYVGVKAFCAADSCLVMFILCVKSGESGESCSLLKSSDSGKTWKKTLDGVVFYEDLSVQCSQDGGTVVCGRYGGYWVSYDAGESFEKSTLPGNQSVLVTDDGATLLAWDTTPSLFVKEARAGASWNQITLPADADPGVVFNRDAEVMAVSYPSGRINGVYHPPGFYISTNKGGSWTARDFSSSIAWINPAGNLIYAKKPSKVGLYVSSDFGLTWREIVIPDSVLSQVTDPTYSFKYFVRRVFFISDDQQSMAFSTGFEEYV